MEALAKILVMIYIVVGLIVGVTWPVWIWFL